MNKGSWEDCLSEGDVKKVNKDIKKSEALKRTAEKRIKFFESQQLNEDNANYIFEGYYTSIIELIHSIMIKQSYNVLNHLCIGFYLRDVIKREDLYRIFDDLRYKRNSLIYYGSEMDFEISKSAIEKCKKLIKELKEINKNA